MMPIYMAIPLFFLVLFHIVVVYRGWVLKEELVVKGFAEAKPVLDYLIKNIDLEPFVEIQFTEQACRPGFITYPLSNWPGTKEGCYCKNKGKHFHLGKCRPSETGQGCTTVFSTKPQPIEKWRNHRICFKQLVEGEFTFSKPDCKASNCCPTDMIPCAKSLCVKKGMKCPISDLVPLDKAAKEGEEVIQVGEKKFLVHRKQGETPLLIFEVIRAQLPCLNPSTPPLGLPETVYPLLNAQPLEAGDCEPTGFDPSAEHIDEEKEAQVYKENRIYPQNQPLPEYDHYIEQTSLHLVSRRKLEISRSGDCANANPKSAKSFQRELNSLGSTVVWTNVMITFLLFVFFIAFLLTQDVSERIIGRITKNRGLTYALGVGWGCALVLIVGLRYLIIKKGSNNLVEANGELQDFVTNECMQVKSYLNAMAQIKLGTAHEDLNLLNGWSFWVTIMLCIPILACVALTYRYPRRKMGSGGSELVTIQSLVTPQTTMG